VYDNNGNRLTRARQDGSETITYTWDYLNRLTDVLTKNAGNVVTQRVHYAYDTAGQRILKQEKETGTQLVS